MPLCSFFFWLFIISSMDNRIYHYFFLHPLRLRLLNLHNNRTTVAMHVVGAISRWKLYIHFYCDSVVNFLVGEKECVCNFSNKEWTIMATKTIANNRPEAVGDAWNRANQKAHEFVRAVESLKRACANRLSVDSLVAQSFHISSRQMHANIRDFASNVNKQNLKENGEDSEIQIQLTMAMCDQRSREWNN